MSKNRKAAAAASDESASRDNLDLNEVAPDPDKSGANPSTGFDLSRFRLSQNFAEQAGVRKLLTVVPVRKPPAQSFVYVHPDQSYRMDVAMIELKEDREYFLVDPAVLPGVFAETKPFTLVTYALRGNAVCIWPIRLPGEDGKDHGAWESSRDAATRYAGQWIRCQWNAQLGAYDIFEATGELAAPEWPSATFPELLEIAFGKSKRIIDNEDHIVIRKLRGDV